MKELWKEELESLYDWGDAEPTDIIEVAEKHNLSQDIIWDYWYQLVVKGTPCEGCKNAWDRLYLTNICHYCVRHCTGDFFDRKDD